MCTLSFYPKQSGFILTSNRDESPNRKTLPPKIYRKNSVELCYPKDALAGGTWIGSSSRKRLVCLMNGGFAPHERASKYKKSRGLIVKEMLSAKSTSDYAESTRLEMIEPFTIIVVDWAEKTELHQLIWDGNQKHFFQLPVAPQIWSAAMLYSPETKSEREEIFQNFLTENPSGLNEKELFSFHKQFIINRKLVKTTSITQFTKSGETSEMRYTDLQNGKEFSMDF